MRLLLIGRPGSGKGTQATAVADHFGIAHISSGDLLREHVAQDTQIGRTVAALMARGDLVPDGFPRTLAQAEAAYQVAKGLGAWVQVALLLDVARDVAMDRMRSRVAGRSDDRADVIRHRQDTFD